MKGQNSKGGDKLNGCLEILDMVFHAYHGLHPEERLIGGKFSVSCWLHYPVSPDADLNTIEQTIDYQDVFNIVETILNNPVNLIEELTKSIYDKLLTNFPSLSYLKVRVVKHDPPIKGLTLTAFELSSTL